MRSDWTMAMQDDITGPLVRFASEEERQEVRWFRCGELIADHGEMAADEVLVTTADRGRLSLANGRLSDEEDTDVRRTLWAPPEVAGRPTGQRSVRPLRTRWILAAALLLGTALLGSGGLWLAGGG
jgi:hypothetical protein